MFETSEDVDTYELIEHAFTWDVRIVRNSNREFSFSYLIGPFFTKWGARRAAKRDLKGYYKRHKIEQVKNE